jgi:CheY-like chemotaxis protein
VSAGLTILVVEDDRYLRRAAEAKLRQRGYRVLLAADGEEGLRLARTSKPDLVLLDLIMPKLQGFEVLRQLKADPTTKAIPVIVMSNLGQQKDRDATLADGAAGYFVKADLSLSALCEAVDRTLGVAR